MPGKTRPQNDLLCVERDVRLYSLTHSLSARLLTAECGDFVESEFGYGPGYLKSMKLLPRQTEELEMKIMGHHREHL